MKFLRPKIKYVEAHLTDHCNLNCKGCGHFCPVVKGEVFTDLAQYKKDITELSKKVRIKEVRLMGGEPLLHPDVAGFVEATRLAYPKATIRLVTNGILLPQMKDNFWAVLRKTRARVDLSKYPPVGNKFAEYLDLIDDNKARLGRIHLSKHFGTSTNFKGTSPVKETYKKCSSTHCITLWRSKLYPCPISYRKYANEFFGTNLLEHKGIDIYKTSGWLIAFKLRKRPIEHCKFCETINAKSFPWEQSKKEMSEWGEA